MNIEDLVYKTGPDGKPKKPRPQPKNKHASVNGVGRNASDFALAVKADLDAKDKQLKATTTLKSLDRISARIGDTKGYSKHIYKDTTDVDTELTEEPAITKDHINDFFRGQGLLSDFSLVPQAPTSTSTSAAPRGRGRRGGRGEADPRAGETVISSSDDSAMQPRHTDFSVSSGRKSFSRRKSFLELDYLYRAARLQTQTPEIPPPQPKKTRISHQPKADPQSVSQPTHMPQAATISSSKGRLAQAPTTTTTPNASSAPRSRRRTKLTAVESDERDEAIYRSLVRVFELQARLEAQKAEADTESRSEGDTLIGRMGRFFGMRRTESGGSGEEHSGDWQKPQGAVQVGEADKKGAGLEGKMKVLATPKQELASSAAAVRSFAQMFSLPNVFRRKP
jgi:hypothetical protein